MKISVRVFLFSLLFFSVFSDGVKSQRKSISIADVARFNSSMTGFRRRAKANLTDVPDLEEKYRLVLNQKKTGFLRLLLQNECRTEVQLSPQLSESALNEIFEECPSRFLLGEGKSYSFRSGDYSKIELADIEVGDGVLFSQGINVQTIFVELGKVELKDIEPDSALLQDLRDLKIENSEHLAIEQGIRLRSGIEINGVAYRNFIVPKLDSVYALRSVAFRGSVSRPLASRPKWTYDVLLGDIRKDILVVFRIVELNEIKMCYYFGKRLNANIRQSLSPRRNLVFAFLERGHPPTFSFQFSVLSPL